jgi:glyoxalase family protein
MTHTLGLHHVTAIARDPVRNAAFYRDVLGLRLVKKTVNFDDPATYHLYYGDGEGAPGTILTFFPWPTAGRGRAGIGAAVETAFAIPVASVGSWLQRLIDQRVEHDPPIKRFGETVVSFRDPDGMHLELVATPSADALVGWDGGLVSAEHAIRGFAGQTIWTGKSGAATARVLTDVFGYRETGTDGAYKRYVADGGAIGARVDLRDASGFVQAAMGAGSIHHIAFRAADDAAQEAMATALRGQGLSVTEQKDRNYFRSVYFREPGGVIFEIATDAPGFAVDEPADALGSTLKLPPWLEPHRSEIEGVLPALA